MRFVNGTPTKKTRKSFTEDCTGDACIGDTVLFKRAYYDGKYPNSTYVGDEELIATIVKDSYGKAKQQHTFILLVHWSSEDKHKRGTKMRIKGRNLYKNGVLRLKRDEVDRALLLEDKHRRGREARMDRDERINKKLNKYLKPVSEWDESESDYDTYKGNDT